jgi:hypothetical protein
MKSIAICLLLLALVGCTDTPQPTFVAEGYVRNVWLRYYFDTTFEHATGEVQVLQFCDEPPMWAGMHVRLYYRHDLRGRVCDVVDGVTRLGPDREVR